MKKLFILSTVVALTGCMVGPDYEEASKAVKLPDIVKAEHFARDAGLWKDAAPADQLAKGDWWKLFGDKTLDALLQRCCKNNPDLASAFYRVEQAREAALMDKADLYPHLNANASYARTGNSQHTKTFAGEKSYDNWATGFGITWDFDLFGRVRSMLEADVANAQAMLCAYQNLMLNLQTNVAKTYFSIRRMKSEIAVLERTLKVRKGDTELVRKRVAMDYSTNIDLKRAIQQEHDAAAQLAEVRRQIVIAENMLALLLGTTPSSLGVEFVQLSDDLPKMPKAIPSELLERRSGIARAERKVFEANARIGVAQAAFFPTVSLSANTGLASSKIDNLVSSNSFAWGVSPQVYIPIFEAGRNVAQKRIALAAHKEALENYKSVVLTAIKEVEDSLATIYFMAQEYKERVKVVEAAIDVQNMTRVQYDEGYTDYFSVSDAQRQCLQQERQLIVLLGARYAACVDLINSLGGGWTRQRIEPDSPYTDKAGRNIDKDFGQNDILPTL